MQYIVEATDPGHATRLVNEQSEHPLVGGYDIGYCSSDVVVDVEYVREA